MDMHEQRARFNAALAAEIRAERAVQRTTLEDISATARVSTRTLIRLMNAERVIGAEVLFGVAEALGVPASELVARAERRLATEDEPATR